MVHGYSIGGTCAVYLATQKPVILVADRTFSRLDMVYIYLITDG
jgi:hypothetical protein